MTVDDLMLGCPGPLLCQSLAFCDDNGLHALVRRLSRRVEQLEREAVEHAVLMRGMADLCDQRAARIVELESIAARLNAKLAKKGTR